MARGSAQPVSVPELIPGSGIAVSPVPDDLEPVLTPAAVAFVVELERAFGARRAELLGLREQVQADIAAGHLPDFLPETADVRTGDWSIAPLPDAVQDRRVEITGPTDRKMVINALNSGASVFMADFEDSNSPTWENMVRGQLNVRDALRGTIEYQNPDGKRYRLNARTAVLMVRPRGWHLSERHVEIDGRPVSASLFDVGLFLFHNARYLAGSGAGPFLYLPKLESYLEARLWNDVFVYAEQRLGIAPGTIKATVLIETILAAFQMDEILYELREHSAGLNCGRWDYIFSAIKKFRHDPDWIMPDRAGIGMTQHLMRSYSLLTIATCHRRGAHAIGGMAAFIPIKGDPAANEVAIAQVVADKRREATDGHDGTWVAHPGLVPVAREIFDEVMPSPNQIASDRPTVHVSSQDLLTVPEGQITEQGLRININVAIQYLESWLRGQGAAAIFNLMEDVATAEISRAQIWQWLHREATLNDGRSVSEDLVRQLLAEELTKIESATGAERFASGEFPTAVQLFEDVVLGDWVDFLTLPGYQYLA